MKKTMNVRNIATFMYGGMATSIVAMVMSVFFCTAAFAAVPQALNYQGRLNDSGGLPVNASKSMKFSFYTSATATVPAWFEIQTISVNQGIFNAVITTLPATVLDNAEVWVGITVDPDAEMTPRQRIMSVGYAFCADKAETATSAGLVTNGVYTTASYANPVWITTLSGNKISGNITGNAANVSGTIAIVNGGTGGTTAAAARTSLDVPGLSTANTFSGGTQTIRPSTSVTKGLVVQGAASQTANLQEWQNSAGTPLATVSASGSVGVQALTAVGTIESTSGGVKFPDGSVQVSAVSAVVPVQVPRQNSLTTVDAAGQVGFHTSITIGMDGLPVISYWDPTNWHLKAAKCGNASCTSGNTLTTVDATGNVGETTSISIGTDGLPVISYYDNTNGHLKVAKCGNASCSSGNTLTTVDATGSVGYYTSIAIGSDGLPIISYRDSTNQTLKMAKCGNASCTSGNILTTVDATGDVGVFSSIAVGSDGLPIISYVDNANMNVKAAKCGNASCSSGNTLTAVEVATFLYGTTSLTIGTDGLPVISYYDMSNGVLKVAKCGNAACSSGNTLTTVDSTDVVGDFNSITIGSDGLPVISYTDITNVDLKVAKCGNAACSSGNTITAVDAAGNVGYYTSITIGTDGLPVIAYHDGANGDLKVARCATQSCVSNWGRR